MKIKSFLRYLPVLSIVVLAGMLLVIVILWTVRNIHSLNARMEEFAARQGVSVIRTLEAGTRTGYLEGDWGIENLQMLIEQAAKDPDVAWVGLINQDGIILSHSEPGKIGLRLLMKPPGKRSGTRPGSEAPPPSPRSVPAATRSGWQP